MPALSDMTVLVPNGAKAPSVALPQELWWLVSQEFASRRDFASLYNCARVSRSLANMALPLLYSIHELSPASTGDALVVDPVSWAGQWACLWRSIIMSSIGKTLYPYCLWIKALNLGNLHSLLEDLARDQYKDKSQSQYGQLRAAFFSPPLESFHILSKAGPKTRHGKRPFMDIERIVIEVANKVSAFIKQSAEQEDKTVTLSSLEGYHLPTAYLPDWVSRLSLLTSLTVRDGSVLNADVSRAIRENCPNFKEVVCHYCMGTDLDDQVAGFFRGLAPNSLESFTVMSQNNIRGKTFQALSCHSTSLRGLSLSIDQPALAALHHLSDCTNLEWLVIEANSEARNFNWEAELKQDFLAVIFWLKACVSLTSLDLEFVPSANTLLSQVLKVSDIRLTQLNVKLLDADEQFYAALGHQTSLETLVVRTNDELVDLADGPRHAQFITSICALTELRKLDLMSEVLTLDDVAAIADALPLLDDFSFDGDLIDDDYFRPLARIPLLKALNINALSNFSFAGILNFITDLAAVDVGEIPPGHDGIRIYVMRQIGENKFSAQEERMLAMEAQKGLSGRVEITYEGDPDDLHESDFSD